MSNLDDVYDALEDMASTPSRNLKLEKLGVHLGEVPWLKETIIYALHPHMHYYINKLPKSKATKYSYGNEQIFAFLNGMIALKGATDGHKQYLADISGYSQKTRTVVERILKKDLRCGVSIKTAQKFISKDDLPLYEVMKPYGDNPFPGKQWDKFINLVGLGLGEDILWAIKVDGYRVSYVTVHKDGSVEYLSTNGKPYDNFKVFDEEIILLARFLNYKYGIKYPMKFDGECVAKDGDFQTMQKQARRIRNVDSDMFRLLLWDVICDRPYFERYELLDFLPTTSGERYDFLETVSKTDSKVFRLEHKPFNSMLPDKASELARKVIADGNEGIILKTSHHLHQFERSDDWFRIKALYLKGEGIEVDLPVIGFEYGRKGTRLEKLLGKFICEYKGNRVGVSGKLSDDQRKKYMEDLPSVIEVNADSETNDGSLRLPIFQRARYDK